MTKQMIKSVIAGVTVTLIMGGIARGQNVENVTLIAPDKPVPTIVVGKEATASEKFAAEELATYLKKITGQDLAVKVGAEPISGTVIGVGKSKLTEHLDIAGLGVEDYIIDVEKNRLLIVGGRKPPIRYRKSVVARDRGTLYGVYELLEQLGVRWYRPEAWGEHVPETKIIALPAGRQTYCPKGIPMRDAYNSYRWWRHETKEQRQAARLFATRNRMNCNMWTPPEYGGYYPGVNGGGHAYLYIIPHKRYFKEHPEYFALIDGKRSDDPGAQLCLSNSDVQDIVTKHVIGRAKSGSPSDISLEPSDGSLWCECDRCRAWDDPNAKAVSGVSMSSRVHRFNNIVLDRAVKEVPDLKASTYAYNQHTKFPTLVNVHPNIRVTVAGYSGYNDYSRLLADPSSGPNAKYMKLLKGWRSKSKKLGVYSYLFGYQWAGPLPVLNVMQDRFRTYRGLDIELVHVDSGNGMHWGAQGINIYMCARLLWNPDLDLDKEIDLYCRNYYGPAAVPMYTYHTMLEKAALKGPWFGQGGGYVVKLYGADLLQKMGKLMAEAQAAVKGQELYEKRLYGMQSGYDYVRLFKKFNGLKNAGKIAEAKAATVKLKTLFLKHPDGSVFENAPASAPLRFIEELTASVEKTAALYVRFKSPSVIQNHDKNWFFQTDPDNVGLEQKWFAPNFDDKKWKLVDADKWWESQGYSDYDGAAWYRRPFRKPVIGKGHHLVIYFGGVDGDAGVYVNGKKVGRHEGDVGDTDGWKDPFFFDITDQVTDDVNQITVRVNATVLKGGMWKGVSLLEVEGVRSEANIAEEDGKDATREVVFQRGLNDYDSVRDLSLWGWKKYPLLLIRDHSASQRLDIAGVPWGGKKRPTLIRFDGLFGEGSGQMPEGAKVISAKLMLYQTGRILKKEPEKQPYISAFVMLTPFYTIAEKNRGGENYGKAKPREDASCFSYRKYSKTLPEFWGEENKIASGPVTKVDFRYPATTRAFVLPIGKTGWLTWDVTKAVREWASGKLSNNGLYMYNSGFWYGASFHSSEYEEDVTLRPKLVVRYSHEAPE